MNTNILKGWKWMFAVGSTIVFLGCINETNGINAGNSNETSVANPVLISNDTDSVETTPEQPIIAPANLSPGISEVIQLAQSGVSEEVLLAYVEKSGRAFNPTVDEIVYLKDLGIPEAVIAALVSQGGLTNEVAIAAAESSAVETNLAEIPQVTSNVPSLSEPPAPSYSVTAESATAAATAPVQDIDINYFQTALEPYGSWIDVPDYGRCWQPTVVVINRNWRPYADRGRWVYTSSGWYWQSDYSWGWAPFHYGRWHNDHRYGWVWVPGSTWAPSWVSWRYTDQYCGWAPLPPAAHYRSGGFYYRNARVGISFDFGLRDHCYTFIPTSRFCDPKPYRYYTPRSHSTTIYRNSVVINNYIRGNNNTIINEGVGRDRISRATRTPIRTVALRDLPTTTSPVGKADRLAGDGKSLVVFRPDAKAQSSLSRSIRASAQNPTATSALPGRSSLAGANSVSRQIPTSRTEPSRSIETSPTQNPSVAAPAAPTTVPRTWSQSPSRQVTTPGRSIASPKVTAPTTSPTQNPTVTTQPGGSSLRQLPSASARSSTAGQEWQSRSSVATIPPNTRSIVAPRNVPSTVTPSTITRERQIVPATPTRTLPSAPASRSNPTWGNSQSGSSIGQSIPAPSQRSIRSIAPSPIPSAPAPRIQQPTFSPPPQVSRDVSRVQRSAPQSSQPAPRVEAPRSAPTRSASPSQGGTSRSIRRN